MLVEPTAAHEIADGKVEMVDHLFAGSKALLVVMSYSQEH
jgi:hypothetical protein